MEFGIFLNNILHPPVLFFILGMLAIAVRSNLEIPPQIGKFLTLYLLFNIGFKGGEELAHSGLSWDMVEVLGICMLGSFFVPFAMFYILRKKLSLADAAAIAAAFGSISAVNFATGISFLESQSVDYSGYMVAAMALMESPAIVSGLILYHWAKQREHKEQGEGVKHSKRSILHEAFFNGSVFLLVGSLFIGILTGPSGAQELEPFVNDIFQGVLSFYMLDMGLIAARRFGELKRSGLFLSLVGTLFPLAILPIVLPLAYVLGLERGDAFLFIVLFTSASYIAVPAAMRTAIPQANMSLLLPTTLGVTFTLNTILGLPFYDYVVGLIWGR